MRERERERLESPQSVVIRVEKVKEKKKHLFFMCYPLRNSKKDIKICGLIFTGDEENIHL